MTPAPTSVILGSIADVAEAVRRYGKFPDAVPRLEVPTMNHRWIAFLPLLLALGGCGYSLTTRLPSHIKTVAVPTFQNETLEYGLEEEITQAVIDRFTEDNNLRVVSEDRADAVVYGVIKAYKRRVAGFTSEEIANEYEVAIIIDVVVRDRVKTKELWGEEGMARTTNYFVDQVESERQGRQPAVQQIAEDIVSRTVQGW
jgi:hypothetical protein